MLRDVVVVGRTRPRSTPLATLTMKKELDGFLFYAWMCFCSRSYGAPLGGSGRWSSAIMFSDYKR